MTAPSRQAGWFGKLPSLGDFAQRRLPPEFVQVWDDWLGAELARVRMRHDSGWLQAYLGSPVWRFVLLPGTLTPAPWLGERYGQVLMTLFEPDGTPTPQDPRQVLAGVLQNFQKMRLRPVVAPTGIQPAAR